MIYLFLDVDGVLNCDSTKERCMGFLGIEPGKVKLLKYIVDMTGAEIVLTSTWKYGWEPVKKQFNDEWANYLDAALAAEGLKAIAKTEDSGEDRGAGIIEYLKEHPAKAWVVLDDMFFNDFKSTGVDKHLLLTASDDDWDGLTQERAEQAVNMFQEQGVEICGIK